MQRADAIKRIKQHELELKRLGVVHLYLFGSTARDEAAEGSDIDLFFDHVRGQIGLYQLMDIKGAASRVLGGSADILTRSSLHPALREEIEASALRVFQWRHVRPSPGLAIPSHPSTPPPSPSRLYRP